MRHTGIFIKVLMVSIAFLICTNSASAYWEDDFENYPLGSFPSPPWYRSGNTSGAYIDDSVSFSGSQSMHLYGIIGACWGVLAFREITVPPPFSIEFMVYNGTENIYGCHPYRGSLELKSGTNWWDCGRGLMVFHEDGRIQLHDSVGWHYNELEWIKVRVDYSRPTDTTVHLVYRINDELLYEVDAPSKSCEDNLAYIVPGAQEGTVWFDDVKVQRGVEVCDAFLTPDKLNVMRSAEHSFKVHVYPCDPMDVSVDDTAEVYVDLDNNGNFDEYENYLAIVSSTDLDGEAKDIAVKVYDVPLTAQINPYVAIYSINNIPIVDTAGNSIDYLQLITFSPHKPATQSALPEQVTLQQNHPNPFNPETIIKYSLLEATYVKLGIYNVVGQRVRALIDEYQRAGAKEVFWDGKDDYGNDVGSGIYFYNIKTPEYSEAKKMILMR